MGTFGDTATVSVLIVIVAVSAFIVFSFHSGKRKNREICTATFNELMKVFKPDDQTFTNIGGTVGHHGTFSFKERGSVSRIDVTLTLLPRQAPLYLPISKFLMRNDRLFISVYMRYPPPGEGHIIEKGYAGFQGPEITNISRLHQMELQWGDSVFFLYYEQDRMIDRFRELIESLPDPGPIRHIAIVPDQRKGFIFMGLQQEPIEAYLATVYDWLFRVFEPY
ncbi:MAG TPA: hypothetical protein VMW06_08625 [Desulfobacterales bacterium]|nr:hypothetical protein [Desulfobacterales bacterium]